MPLVAGIYPAAPASDPDDLDASGRGRQFVEALVASASRTTALDGLELPWVDGCLHAGGEDAFLSLLPTSWRHVVTAIPDTMVTSRSDPQFGLASPDEAGRRRAVAGARRLRDHLASLTQRHGRPLVRAVEIQSAPRRAAEDDGRAGVAALHRSLGELAGWDWSGATLVVEHCDAVLPSHPAAKGFLTLDDEIRSLATLRDLATPVEVGLNWARSVIEGRSRGTALDHARTAAASGRLGCLMFSGVADPGPAGAEWLDSHLAPAPIDPTSLLRDRDMLDTVQAVAGVVDRARWDTLVVGVKVTCGPGASTPDERAADVVAAVSMLQRAVTAAVPRAGTV